jgi:hypothetical protein
MPVLDHSKFEMNERIVRLYDLYMNLIEAF